uniref:Uncharacterized protein n=1 Tax=Eptatretus burgeri TaxID=7764 RepID=A0A8C4Q6D6_EPTBU
MSNICLCNIYLVFEIISIFSHDSKTTSWLDPRRAKFQKPLEECDDDELPYGWEKIDDPQYGTYYVDHLNRRTQFENPVLEAKKRVRSGGEFSYWLMGPRVHTTLCKTTVGFGFTIVGGERPNELLQINELVPDGPAALDGGVQRGDTIVAVDGMCVLGRSQADVVRIFQAIPIGSCVSLELCRGYPLPQDPLGGTLTTPGTPTNMGIANGWNVHDPLPRPSRSMSDIAEAGQTDQSQKAVSESENLVGDRKSELLSITVVKGLSGFGFTVADSAEGQRIKHILDASRGYALHEDDLIVEVAGRSVRGWSHLPLVQLLKDWPAGVALELCVVYLRASVVICLHPCILYCYFYLFHLMFISLFVNPIIPTYVLCHQSLVNKFILR